MALTLTPDGDSVGRYGEHCGKGDDGCKALHSGVVEAVDVSAELGSAQ